MKGREEAAIGELREQTFFWPRLLKKYLFLHPAELVNKPLYMSEDDIVCAYDL